MDTNFEQKVRERAYEIWMSAGMTDGMAHEHWVIAEQAVANETGEPVKAKKTTIAKAAALGKAGASGKAASPAKKPAATKAPAKAPAKKSAKAPASKVSKAKH